MYFRLYAKNGEIILQSEGYKTLAGCKKGIEAVKKNAGYDKSYKHKSSSDGKDYFVLIAKNGEIIGVSETYESKKNREIGMKSVKVNAPVAAIEDISKK